MKNFEAKIIVQAENKESVVEMFKNLMLKAEVSEVKTTRSLSQNAALHKWMELLEEECTARGITMDMIITKPQDIPVTKHILKDLFRFIGKKMFGIKSTAELSKDQFGNVQKTFEKNLSQNAELYIPFPSLQSWTENDNNPY